MPLQSGDLIGCRLSAIKELVWDNPGHPNRTAIGFCFDERMLVIQALTDSSELVVSFGLFASEDPELYVRDASGDAQFRDLIGKPVRNWWFAQNGQGYDDAFMLALDTCAGLCLVAMNDQVSVLRVSGEQWA